jgi:hypothetical protein
MTGVTTFRNVDVTERLRVDTIEERTADNGVNVDGVLLKDGGITYGASGIATVDTINERTTDNGVNVDGVLLKDGGITCADAAVIAVDRFQQATTNGDFQLFTVGSGSIHLKTDNFSNPVIFGDPTGALGDGPQNLEQYATHSNSATNAPVYLFRRSGNSAGSPFRIPTSGRAGTIEWQGYGATDFYQMAYIRVLAAQNGADDDVPGDMSFAVTPDAAGTSTVRLALAHDGGVTIHNIATASLPSTPTGGAGTLIYDSTANKLKFWNGSAYETVTSA